MMVGAGPSWDQPMRREDRKVEGEEAWEILRKAEVCRVAFCHDGWPYIVPMNFGIHNGSLYFHCAAEGTKLDLLRQNAGVCFEAEADAQIVPGEEACGWSVRYRSVIGFGSASIVEDPTERRLGVKALLAQYSDRAFAIPEAIPPNTIILRVAVSRLTGKASTAH